MVAFVPGEAEQPLLEDRVLLVPQREGEADRLMPVADAREAVLVPAIGARPRMIVREVLPGSPVRAVVLADGAPRALAEVRSPPLPVVTAVAGFLEALFFGRHRSIHLDREYA